MRCPVCNNFEFKKVFNLYDDRYGEPNLYSIKECLKCGHYCTYPRIKNEELSNLYGNFYQIELLRDLLNIHFQFFQHL